MKNRAARSPDSVRARSISKKKPSSKTIPPGFDKTVSPYEAPYRSKIEGLSALIKISTAIGSMPIALNETLQFLVDETRRLFDAYLCAIFLFDAHSDFQGVFSSPIQTNVSLKKEFRSARGCIVVRDELPLIVQDTKKRDPRCRCFELGDDVGSYACVPISTGKRLLGILLVGDSDSWKFHQDRLEMMLSVASMAASAIQRAQLFTDLREEKSRLEKANLEITELNKALQQKIKQLKTAQDQIIQAEKLAVAGRLAAGVSHELNNPIGIIVNRIECLLAEAQDMTIPREVIKDLEIIHQYANKISAIVKDLSVFSRTTYSTCHFHQVDINDIMTDVFFLVEQKIDTKTIKLVKELYPAPLLVMGDPTRLEQVFVNILDNAIDAITGKGWIRVSTKAKENKVQVQVADSGIGIPQEHVNKIYEPFFTTKEVGKGTGLGLTISYAIIKDHNGSIDVETNAKAGTCFTICLPKAE